MTLKLDKPKTKSLLILLAGNNLMADICTKISKVKNDFQNRLFIASISIKLIRTELFVEEI